MRRATAAAVALLLAAPAVAGPRASAPDATGDLRPMQPRFVTVGDRGAVVYFTETAGGYEVVVTIAANTPDDGSSVRTVATLAPGQRHVLMVGGTDAAPAGVVVIERRDDALVVIPSAEPQRRAAAQ